ncbi:MAG: hypothetical protein JSV05_01745 [Candidatus Bathyarchaeota archaeon]|nr:MAG: hypothetical protein JSV05_01745 [Candidatus Bathyarchaeota archaeon]
MLKGKNVTQHNHRALIFESKTLALIIIFAAFGVVCDVFVLPGLSAGIWFGAIFLISPITGIVLGPYSGFVSTLMAVMIGHWLVPRETNFEFIFTLGAPVGSMISGFLFRRKLKRVIIFFTVLLVGYFITPISWQLPLWGMWDTYLAYALLLVIGVIVSIKGPEELRLLSPYALSAFVGLQADVLVRIFILVPLQTYHHFYGLSAETLIAIWTFPAPIITPFKVLLSTFMATLLTPQILRIMEKNGPKMSGMHGA